MSSSGGSTQRPQTQQRQRPQTIVPTRPPPVLSTPNAANSASFSLLRESPRVLGSADVGPSSGSRGATATTSRRVLEQELVAVARGIHSASTNARIDAETRWTSNLLALEVRLRELVADGPSEPPSISRMEEVLTLFDSFSVVVPEMYKRALQMFRVEFCRAIFSGVSGTGVDVRGGAPSSDAAQVPFFEKIDKMLRERNILQAELEAVETDHNVADLKKQITKLSSLIPFYEQEVGRLARENDRHQEELNRVRKEMELSQAVFEKTQRHMEDEARKLTTENRELQLQVFRLSKDSRHQQTTQSMYQHMKQQKSERIQEMFSRGDEAAGLLLFCHQLEHSLNTVMNDFDLDFAKANVSELPSLRIKLIKKVILLLEELHHCEFRMEAITALSETRCLSALRASALFDLEINKQGSSASSAQQKLMWSKRAGASSRKGGAASKPLILGSDGGGSSDAHHASSSAVQEDSATATVEVAAKRAEWVKTFLGSSVEHRDIFALAAPVGTRGTGKGGGNTGATTGSSSSAKPTPVDPDQPNLSSAKSATAPGAPSSRFPYHTTQPGEFLKYVFVNPLLDITSSKFMMGVDLHAYSAGTTTHLRTVNFVDPTAAIDVPPKTTHVKLKFTNPTHRAATTTLSDEQAAEVRAGAVSNAMEWSPQLYRAKGADELLGTAKNSGGRSNSLSTTPIPGEPGTKFGAAMSTTGSDPPHWRLYKRLFSTYKPYLPRVLDSFQIDFLMFQVCQRHMMRLSVRYESCRETASQRSTNSQMAKVVAERLFRDEFDPIDFQVSLVEVLEARYCFPELVGKSLYELLTSLESLGSAAPQTQVYLDCIGGVISCWSTFVCSAILHSISSYWPASLSQIDQEVAAPDVLAVLRYLYPSEANFRVDLDSLINELLLHCQDHITLRATRLFFIHGVLQTEEAMLKRFRELFSYRAEVVQWTELEFGDMFDIIKGFVGDETAANSVAFFLESCCVLGKTTRLPTQELSCLSGTMIISHMLKSKRV